MEIKSDLDKAKRVYRAAVDAVKKLDEALKQKKAYREVFHQDAVGLRYKLKEYCERLMFYNPLFYGRKAEEVLWRKVFYDIIQLIKHNRRHVRPGSSLETAYRRHLSAALGYYHHLLFRLQSEFDLKLDNILDFPLLPDKNPGRYGKPQRKHDVMVTPMIHEWAMKACHRCLVCLGDIARYQQDFDNGLSSVMSERFYQQALTLYPDIGMPHNQLGTLASSRYFHCEAAYHYIRCMVCEQTFEGATGNLQRLFEKNQKRYQDLKQEFTPTANPNEQCYHDLKGFFIQFLHLLMIFFDSSKNVNSQDIQESCQKTLQSFNLCMFYEPVIYSEDLREENLQYLEDDIVFKVVIICMATAFVLKKRGSRQVTAATAFLLALFSHILNHVVIRLQGALYEKENPNKLLQSSSHLYDLCNGDDSGSDSSSSNKNRKRRNNSITPPRDSKKITTKISENKDDSSKHKTKKSRVSRLRSLRRRRPKSNKMESDDSDFSEISDLSEGGNDVDETFVSDDSEEEEHHGFYADSDSDMSDSMMKSQELEPGFAIHPEAEKPNTYADVTVGKSEFVSPLFPEIDQNKIWSESKRNDSLAHFSSELFSSSVPFLGTSLKIPSQNIFEKDLDSCNDVVQGKKAVTVPPGFASTTEAKHVEEISQKLANFVIETDTEASVTATEVEADTEFDEGSSEENDRQGSSEEEKELLHQRNVFEVIQGEGLMPVVKVMCDWMKCNSEVIMTCAQSSQSVWCRLSVLLNFLPSESTVIDHEQCWIDELKQVVLKTSEKDWKQLFPLHEDTNLTQFGPLKEIHKTINMKISTKLNDAQEGILRTCCLRQFGYFLSQLEGLQFSYNEEKGIFIGPTQPTATEDSQEVAMEKLADAESRRNQLMRDMAQLRLQAEVSQLEGSLSNTDQAPFPPYLIPDTSSLCTTLHLIRQLAQSNRSIIVIPLAVIDTLDFQKKESSGAREAIRWLESEFRKGNRYIRAQKSSEKLQTSPHRQLKKKNRDAWCILEILNCALYLSRQGGDFGAGSVISVLTTCDFSANKHPLVKQALGNSQQEGVAVENISNFVTKWKINVKSKG